MTAEDGQDYRLTDNDEPCSQFTELKTGETIAESFRTHSLALLAVLQELAQVDDSVLDAIGDTAEVDTRLEEIKPKLAESRELPGEEPLKRIKAYIEAPSLIERIRARIRAEEQRKRNDELLRCFGQERHTSIN